MTQQLNLKLKAGKSAFLLIIISATMSILNSCSKDENSEVALVSVDDAVDAIAYSASTETNGLTTTIDAATEYASFHGVFNVIDTLNCGQLYEANYRATRNANLYSYDYTGTRNYKLNCDGAGNRQSFDYNFTLTGSYDAPRMSSEDEINSQFQITQLGKSGSAAVFNGTYKINSTHQSKVRNKMAFTSDIVYSLTNISVNKSDFKVLSGTAAVSFKSVSSSGNEYTYNGKLTFNGDGTAVLEINGNTYTIHL